MSSAKDIMERITDSKYYSKTGLDTDLLEKTKEIKAKIKEQENLIEDACYLINLFEKDLADRYHQLMEINRRFADPCDILKKARAIIAWNKLKSTKKIKDMTEEELSKKPSRDDTHIIDYVATKFFGKIADKYKPKLVEAFSYGFTTNAIDLIFELEGINTIRFEITIPNNPMSGEAAEARAYQYRISLNEKWKTRDGAYGKDWSNSYESIVEDFKLDTVREVFEKYFEEKIEGNDKYGIKF